MHSRQRARLILRLVWLAVLVLVIVGSLLPASSAPAVQIFDLLPDKVLHLSGYLVLGLLPAVHERLRTVVVLTLVVVALGVALEYGQAWMHAGRMFEVLDMAANATGAATGVAIGRLLGGRRLRALLSSRGSATDTRMQPSGTGATSPHIPAPAPGSRGVPARKPSGRQPVSRDRRAQVRPDAAGRT